MLKPVDYDDNQHRNYARGRPLLDGARARWMQVFAAHAPAERPLTVLDLGSGTGRITTPLAETFGEAVGVEPSAKMRATAEAATSHPRVRFLAGQAEAIPLGDDSCDLVLMNVSFHHVRDRPAAAREIARVLKADGRLLMRSPFSDRLPDITWHRYFPRAREVELAMFPTTAEVEALFAKVGLRQLAFETVREPMAESLKAEAEQMRLRAISTFEHLTEAEIAAGQAALDAAASLETEPQPTYSESDLMVLGR
jgi:ubiquinone/menaquinone biosynthesis C-methylase UbiE